MAIKFDLDQVISQVGRDKGINKEILIEALESAVLSAAKKHFGHGRNLEASFNEELSEIEVIEFKTVVERVQDTGTQITLAEARKDFDPEAEIGDELGKKLNGTELGRIAAQTAKQVIIQKIRDAERDILYSEFKDRKGEIVNGIVQRVEKGSLIVNLGRTDAVLPEREQISKERYRQNDRIRAMILDIYSQSRGPQVVLTRSHPDFMKKLFKVAVPEIAEGIVEIKSVAREAGDRAKIAVYSNDPNVDPVGACVGIKGTRVQTVVSELRGERIDIVTWTPDAPSFVARALAPADVLRVIVDEEENAMEVVVADDQLSLAIGRKGQNVKLASKLTGWRIDVRSESVAEEETKKARNALESIPGIGFGESELLFQEGYRTVREIAMLTPDELVAVEGIDPERVDSLLAAAREQADKIDMNKQSSTDEVEKTGDIDLLIIPQELKVQLVEAGYTTIQSLSDAGEGSLVDKAGLSSEQAAQVSKAASSFLGAQGSQAEAT